MKMKEQGQQLLEDIKYYDSLIREGGPEIEISFWEYQRDLALSELRKLNGLKYYKKNPVTSLKVVK